VKSSYWKSILAGISLLFVMLGNAAWSQDAVSSALETYGPLWLGPLDMELVNPSTVCVMEADAHRLQWTAIPCGESLGVLELPARPNDMLLSEGRLFVACGGPRGSIIEVDASTHKLLQQTSVGHTPTGLSIAPDLSTLYVCNRFDNEIVGLELSDSDSSEERAVVSRWTARREPIATTVSADGASLFVANHLPDMPANNYFTSAVVEVIDVASGDAKEIMLPNGSNALRDIEIDPQGGYVYLTHTQANFLAIPFQVTGGWTNRNALSVIDAKNHRLCFTVILDDYSLGAANPWQISFTPQGDRLAIVHAGSDELTLIDLPELRESLGERVFNNPIPGGTLYSPGTLQRSGLRIPLPLKGPRSLVVNEDAAIVAGYFSDAFCVVPFDEAELHARDREPLYDLAFATPLSYDSEDDEDPEETEQEEPVPPLVPVLFDQIPRMTLARRGELLFHDGTICYQMWQSCASCHPDARTDAINWDLMNDGAGNPKNSKSMLESHPNPPAMATGVRATAEIAVRAGLHHILFADRPEGEAVAIDAYLSGLKPVPSPYLTDEGELTESALRGQDLFNSPRVGCYICHPLPYYTDRKLHEIGDAVTYPTIEEFDTPVLHEAWRTAPYLHNGAFDSIEVLLKEGRHGETRGQLERLSEQQIDDLIEFVLSL
jgi:hypothetical protein